MTRPMLDYNKKWEIHTIQECPEKEIITNVMSGGTPPTVNLNNWGGTIPWLTPKEITEQFTYRYKFSTKRLLTNEGLKNSGGSIQQSNTVMLTKRAPVGSVIINKTPMATNQGFLNFQCGKKLLPEFLLFWFRANKSYLERVANGSTYDELYPSDLFELEIAIPPINEQKKIIQVLSYIEDKINYILSIKQRLEFTSKSLFKSMFLDVGEQKIPKNWKKEKLEKILRLSYGKALQENKRKEGEFPVYGSSGIVGFHNESIVKGPGIVLGRKGNVGSLFWSSKDFFPIDTVFFIESELPKYFLFHVLQTMDFDDGDTAVPGLKRDSVYDKEFLIPDDYSITKFQEKTINNIKLHDVLDNQLVILNQLLELLLPKLVSGIITVKYNID